jgi:hypothetical protein
LLVGLVWAGLVSAAEDPQVKLTPQETEWIAAHPVIEVGVFAGNHYPLEAWVAGAPEGIGIDYAKLLASRVGMRVQFRPFTDWEAVSLGEMPASLDLLVGQSHGFTSHFDYLNPYVQTQFVLVARRGDLKIRSEADLAHARIAVERISIGYTRIVKSHFPDATLVFSTLENRHWIWWRRASLMRTSAFPHARVGCSASVSSMTSARWLRCPISAPCSRRWLFRVTGHCWPRCCARRPIPSATTR